MHSDKFENVVADEIHQEFGLERVRTAGARSDRIIAFEPNLDVLSGVKRAMRIFSRRRMKSRWLRTRVLDDHEWSP